MRTGSRPNRSRLAVPAILAAVIVLGCAHAPRWTPEDVAPPSSLDAALQAADQAVAEERAALPTIAPATLELTRDGAILACLARNRSLRVERFGPAIVETSIAEARADFDPRLLATTSYAKSGRPSGVTSGDESAISRDFSGNATLSEFLPTGTEMFLSGGFSRIRSSGEDSTYGGSWSAGINQDLLRGFGTDVNLVTLRQARNTAAIQQHELRGFVIDLVQQVESAYWELVLAREKSEIRKFSVDLAHEQLQLNEDLIEVGKIAEDARVSAEAELASRRADLVDAESDVKARTIDLIRLLNPETGTHWNLILQPVDPPDVTSVDLDPDMSAVLADLYRPELAQSRLDLANRDLDVVRTRNGLLPRLTAFASYQRLSSGDSTSGIVEHLDDPRFEGYEAGVSLDVSPLNRGERARNDRAELGVDRAEAALSNLEQLVETDVRQAVIEAQRQWEQIAANREVVKSREEELRVERGRFVVGKSTNLDVLQVERNLIEAQLNEVTARVRYIEALTDLYSAEGTLLDRRGIAPETATDAGSDTGAEETKS
jgi:outer membrane protein TolC